jgi:hypothetical protein
LAAAETSENPHKIEFSLGELDLQRNCQFNRLACVGEYLQVSLLERILGNLGVRLPTALMDEDRRLSPLVRLYGRSSSEAGRNNGRYDA